MRGPGPRRPWPPEARSGNDDYIVVENLRPKPKMLHNVFEGFPRVGNPSNSSRKQQRTRHGISHQNRSGVQNAYKRDAALAWGSAIFMIEYLMQFVKLDCNRENC